MADPELGIRPDRAGTETDEVGRDLEINAHPFVPAEFVLEAWYEHRVVIGLGHMPVESERGDVVGEIVEHLDHDAIVSAPSVAA
jgi:hypothetical protein